MMMWAVYIGLIIAGLFLKNSRAYAAFVVLFMGALAWNNTDAADYYAVYWLPYQNPDLYPSLDQGWIALCRLGGMLGLSYNGFACLVAMSATYLLYRFAKGAGVNTAFFLALVLIYPGLISLVQLRQFFASAIVAAALLFLKQDGRLKYLMFALAVFLAFLVHRSAILMAVMLVAPLFDNANDRLRMAVLALAALAAVTALANAQEFATFLFGTEKTESYLYSTGWSNAVSELGGARNAVYIFAMLALSLLCWRFSRRDAATRSLMDERASRIVFSAVMVGNVAMLALLPFSFISNDFMRFERYAFTYALALFALMPMLERRDPVFSCKAFYVVVCLAFAYPFVIAGTFNTVYVPLLSIEPFPAIFG